MDEIEDQNEEAKQLSRVEVEWKDLEMVKEGWMESEEEKRERTH